MKRKTITAAFFLGLFLFFLLSLSKKNVEKIRETSLEGLSSFRDRESTSFSGSYTENQKKIDQLSLENEMLKAQMGAVKEWLLFEERLDEEVKKFSQIGSQDFDQLYWQEFFLRRKEEISRILQLQMQAICAKVIFRDPSSWGSSIWVNVGEESNEYMGRFIVEKNSPVVLGRSLVGVVEYVGKKSSRIRLITDSGLTPSVRVVRGEMQDRILKDHLDKVLDLIYPREDFLEEEKQRLSHDIAGIKEKLSSDIRSYYLAKGELCGAVSTAFRKKSYLLKGRGFNYDYADEEGGARHLSTGHPFTQNSLSTMPLLIPGDLLVTTGYDAVFPPGLHVGIVTKVDPLQEGEYAYSLEAKPTVASFDSLDVVFILPPLEYQTKEL
ncbi:MAG: rod shape-determining protein MreC [Parachlamydiales bacterium]|nr:rod shape-determining protein MreC [Parachlamydiales bacterium]